MCYIPVNEIETKTIEDINIDVSQSIHLLWFENDEFVVVVH